MLQINPVIFRLHSIPLALSLVMACLWSEARAQSAKANPECAVDIVVMNASAGLHSGSERPLRRQDTAIVLDIGKPMDLAVVLTNKGRAEGFDVSVESAKGSSLTAGGGSRKVTIKAGQSTSLPVTLRGESPAGACRWESRSVRILVKQQGTAKICGQVEKRFLCLRKPASPPGG